MRSIGARLALWYAGVSTVTLACLVFAGYYLLSQLLVHGLDLLNEAEFEHIRTALGSESTPTDRATIEDRIRGLTESGAVLFFIDVHDSQTGLLFSSSNLKGRRLPDGDGRAHYNAEFDGVGDLRIASYSLGTVQVQVGTPLAQVRNLLEGYAEISLIVVCLMLVVSMITGLALSRAVLRPVRLIQETAYHIRSDNLSERIPVPEVRDEVSNLARLLNEMFERLELSFHQIRRFTAEASHELKTPLSLVRLHAENLLVQGGLAPAQEEAVQLQLEELERLNKIIEELLFLSRAEAHAVVLKFQREDPRAFLDTFAQDARVLVEHRGLRFVLMSEGRGTVEFDPKWMRQVLFNLIQNAINVSPPGGTIVLRSDFTLESWKVFVEDEGAGVPKDQQARIFERFVRLAPGREEGVKGSGLGLAICKSVIGLHHGTIRAETPARGIGLRVIFEIPLYGEEEA